MEIVDICEDLLGRCMDGGRALQAKRIRLCGGETEHNDNGDDSDDADNLEHGGESLTPFRGCCESCVHAGLCGRVLRDASALQIEAASGRLRFA